MLFPVAQFWHPFASPSSANLPIAHFTHTEKPALLVFPLAHLAQSTVVLPAVGASAPTAAFVPVVQAMPLHTVDPSWSVYFPATQLMHSFVAGLFAVFRVSPSSFMYVPFAQREHFMHAAAPLVKYSPTAHVCFLHAALPVSSWYSPPAQAIHVLSLAWSASACTLAASAVTFFAAASSAFALSVGSASTNAFAFAALVSASILAAADEAAVV
jgi:hypothetical protein